MKSISPNLLKLWSILIIALGAFYIVTWTGAPVDERDSFSLAVGIFCLIAGAGTFVMSFILNKK